MSHKIALICIERDSKENLKEFTPPFGLLSAASVIRSCGWDVSVHHIVASDGFEVRLQQLCQGANAVGFTVMTTPNLHAVLQASRFLKEQRHMVFWGGSHPTLLPEIALSEQSVDVVMRGESERFIPPFLEWLADKKTLDLVPGACYRKADGRIHVAPMPILVSSSELAWPAFDLIDATVYLHRDEHTLIRDNRVVRNVLPIITSRGCTFRCSFCYNQAVHQSTWRGLSLDSVLAGMDNLLERYAIGGWYFYDDNFFVDQNRAWRILRRHRLPSFVEAHVSSIDDTFIQNALQAGVCRLYIGGESGSDAVLKRIRKASNVARLLGVVSNCSRAGLPVTVSLLTFLPEETPEEMQATFALKNILQRLPLVSVDGPKVYNPYPGTECYKQLIDQGWSAPANNADWAEFARNMNPLLAGFSLTPAHGKVLDDNGFQFELSS